MPNESLLDLQQAFGYTQEDIKFIMAPMGANGEEPIGSMGNDSPLAVLSNKNKTLYHYFKQLFAQVTNPPIDPIREELVTSLVSFIGPKPNLLGIDEMNPPLRLEVSQPVLDFEQMETIRHIERYTDGKFKSFELDITYPLAWGKEAIEARLASLAAQAEDAVRAGFSILIISDRTRAPRPARDSGAARAVRDPPAPRQQGAAHLDRPGRRDRLGARGASLRAARRLRRGSGAPVSRARDAAPTSPRSGMLGADVDAKKACKNFVKAIGKGLKKVMSKMGISTYMSYTGAQIFEAVGLSRALIDKYFSGTTSNVGGIGVFEVAEEAIRVHRAAFSRDPVLANALDAGGEYAWRVRGEEHMWTPDAIAKLQHAGARGELLDVQGIRADHQRPVAPPHDVPRAVRVQARSLHAGADRGSRAGGRDRQALLDRRDVARLDLDRSAHDARDRDEPHRRQVEHRRRRRRPQPLRARQGGRNARVAARARAASSATSSSRPATRSNRRSSRSPRAASASPPSTSRAPSRSRSRWRRARSPAKAASFPARKVSEYIALLRYSTPGVELISPPPHHDIYSIEDLAQLIHDLKNANSARVDLGEARLGSRASARSPRASRRPRPTTSRSPATTAAPARRRGRRSSTPARRGSSGSPRRSRRSC